VLQRNIAPSASVKNAVKFDTANKVTKVIDKP
jgi:hypothetical protein